jgi:hypothetical protein
MVSLIDCRLCLAMFVSLFHLMRQSFKVFNTVMWIRIRPFTKIICKLGSGSLIDSGSDP